MNANQLSLKEDIYIENFANFEYGIFKKCLYKDNIIELPDFVNSQEILISKQAQTLFEPYFFFETLNKFNKKETYDFRQISKNLDKYKQLDELNSDLMLNSLNCKCVVLPVL